MRILIALGALSLLSFAASCATPTDTAGAPNFGAAVKAMEEAQTETGAEVVTTPPEGSGAVGAAAQLRYKNGETRPLLPASSSTMNSSTR
jgi:hypothetical protein